MAQLILEVLFLTTASVFVGTLAGGYAANGYKISALADALSAAPRGRTAQKAPAASPVRKAHKASPTPLVVPPVAPFALPPPLSWLGSAPPRDDAGPQVLPPPLSWLGTPAASPEVIKLPALPALETAERATATQGLPPAPLSGPIGGRADDLKRIKGIGAQTENRLNGFGIYHIAQIADLTPENIVWLNSRLGVIGRAERSLWPAAAQALLAEGQASPTPDEEAF
ncbi:hypothetical protein [Chthonobacter rhizosphaerae]|uniref:hypothetical protein n=1 Tax=Chthonobacter rhizosphaerae TaxID=2735553 RepID=UPI0015EF4070|nr:hypothetical protein [Chthonobacter rhizosphaerae]